MNKNDSFKRAIAWVERGLAEGVWQNGERLPAVKEMARSIHINIHMLNRALQKLCDEEKITIVNRKGIFAGRNAPLPALRRIKGAKPKHEIVRATLEQDILHNVFKTDLLPSITELKRRYGVSTGIIRSILLALADEKVVIPFNRRYRLPDRSTKNTNATIVLISRGLSENNESISIFNDRFKEGIYALEIECRSHRLNLAKIGIRQSDSGSLSKRLKSVTDPFGYILWINGLSTDTIFKILSELASHDKPVALIDESGIAKLPFAHHRFKIFSMAGLSAGKQVGRYLLTRGHRHIAYISDRHEELWFQQRLQGLTDVYTKAGFPLGVKPLLCEREDFPPARDHARNALVRSIIKQVSHHAPLMLWSVEQELAWLVHHAPEAEFRYNRLTKQFALALQDKTITAWVGANDFIAVSALHYLQLHGHDQKKKPALIGFDDAKIATAQNLTSYNFSFPSIIEKALTYILNPQHKYYWNKSSIECEGIIMERSSG